jgi:membrane protein
LRRKPRAYARHLVEDVVEAFQKNNLLTYANAIAFRVFFALVPFFLFLLGLAGALGLEGVYQDDVNPEIAAGVSPAARSVIESTVEKVLRQSQVFWITLGAALAVWEVSAAVRAVIGAFNRVYGAEEEQPIVHRFALSIGLALGVGLVFVLAIAIVWLTPVLLGGLPGVLTFVIRWSIALVLLFAAAGLLVRYAPATRQPWEWVGFGAMLTVLAWFLTSVAFGFYLTRIADYGSIFGTLATLFIALEYLYLSSIAFLIGVQVDAVLRRESGDRSLTGSGDLPA